jgi:hypothetical protein
MAKGLKKAPDALFLTYISDFLASSDGLSLIKAFMQIKETGLRRSIVHLVEEVAGDHN